MNISDTYQSSNIYVPGLSRPVIPEKIPDSRTIYTDKEVALLPRQGNSHPPYPEWAGRDASSRRLVRYLSKYKKAAGILEIGCGNGWFSHLLAEIPGSEVTGLDINFTELQQAARVFSDDPNLNFIHGDIRSGILGDRTFDIIIFAATIQYFPSLKKILHLTLAYLKPGGEIHVTDSHLYKPEEIPTEKNRTLAYYTSLGYPEMADFYYHHSITDLRSFHHDWLHRPHSMMSRFLGIKNPWPWVRVTNN